MDVHVYEDHEAASNAAARLVIDAAHRSLERCGRFTIALTGGSTPRRLYELLADEPFWRAMPWDRTHVFFGDDRAVPTDHEWSNYGMAHGLMLSRVPLPKANVHRMRGELDPRTAAEAYDAELRSVFGEGVPEFDLALLGVGMDGHVASIFPDSKVITETCTTAAVINPPADPKVDRITLCLPVFNNARHTVLFATGPDKKAVLEKILHTKTARHLFPAAMVNGPRTTLLTDQDVAVSG